MNFNMKKPCQDCPFRPGSSTNETLAEGRLDEIVSDIRGGSAFICHKTLDHVKNNEHCAGALVFLEREDRPNQLMRVAERLGVYDRHKLDMTVEIIPNEPGPTTRRRGEPEEMQLGLFDII